MSASAAGIAQLDPHAEAWVWWLVLVIGLSVVMVLVVLARRWFVAPMKHTPSDTSDAWKEAGRRMAVPPAETGEDQPPEDGPA